MMYKQYNFLMFHPYHVVQSHYKYSADHSFLLISHSSYLKFYVIYFKIHLTLNSVPTTFVPVKNSVHPLVVPPSLMQVHCLLGVL